jgi:hypothetical protein
MRFYTDYADWWPLLSPAWEYEKEAGIYSDIIRRHLNKVSEALELGAGAGSNAYHLKSLCHWVLTDVSEPMMNISRRLNPECEHISGDMRTLELGRVFDLVFIHDAISSIITREDLALVAKTAFSHLRDGGMLLITPDHFTETYLPGTDWGGYDEPGTDRALRYLEWTYDSNPQDAKVELEYSFVFRHADGSVESLHEHADSGLFSMEEWQDIFEEEGFSISFEQIWPGVDDGRQYHAIIGLKPY